MKQSGLIAVLGVAALWAGPGSARPAASRVTTKAAEPFAQCLVASQERESRAWSFVPKADGGGTFSNAGATGVRYPYFLDVADRGKVREIRLMPASDRAMLRAIDSCI